MTGVLRRHKRHREDGPEERGRDRSDAVTSQGTEARKGQGGILPNILQRECGLPTP